MPEEKKPLSRGDACPSCGGELAAVAGAPIKDKSALYRCTRCAYQTRFSSAPVEKPSSRRDA